MTQHEIPHERRVVRGHHSREEGGVELRLTVLGKGARGVHALRVHDALHSTRIAA